LLVAVCAGTVLGGGSSVRGQEQTDQQPGAAVDESLYPGPDMPGYGPPPVSTPGSAYGAYTSDQQDSQEAAMIPPNVEGDPFPAPDGGYCYVGPHPVDTRINPGSSWDPTEGQHIRPYAPVDTRLFTLNDGCYYFTGDPRDFGYAGQTYAYYGAHPVLDVYGGGWCFMMGGHAHLWRPWSPYFSVVGSWNYWQGPYDPFFWTYWPYYSFYYRSYYPHYYGGGRFYRGGGYRVAPPIRGVPASAWRGAAPGRTAPVVRGAPPTQMYRSAAPPSSTGTYNQGWGPPRAVPQTGGRPSYAPPSGPGSSFSPGPRPSFSPAPRPVAPSRPGGMGSSFHGGGRR
jgi:hypothetical protein